MDIRSDIDDRDVLRMAIQALTDVKMNRFVVIVERKGEGTRTFYSDEEEDANELLDWAKKIHQER